MSTDISPAQAGEGILFVAETPAQRAERFGLAQSGARPTLLEYVKDVWAKRHFISSFATANTLAAYTHAKLGQIWQILTPLLNAAVYFLIFGELLHTSRGIHHFMGFLVTGVFVFNFTMSSINYGTRAISARLELIRALHFPRACLPIAYTLTQLQQLAISVVVFVVIDVANGAGISWRWILVVPALVLLTVFNTGCTMIVARLGARTPDVSQLMPFLLRTWMYCSGLFYSISTITKSHSPWIKQLLDLNPMVLFIDVIRSAMNVTGGPLPHHAWIEMVAWTVVVGVGGFVYFWQAEEQYGRG
jgi:teichoic acid transport system permease protein